MDRNDHWSGKGRSSVPSSCSRLALAFAAKFRSARFGGGRPFHQLPQRSI